MPPFKQCSTLGNYTPAEKNEIFRVSQLTDRQIRRELREIMGGTGYSWYTISQRLRAKASVNLLEMEHFEPGNILYEWNVLCDEKLSWQLQGRPSFRSFRFSRDCLIKLKIIPTQAGLGLDVTTTNMDPKDKFDHCLLVVGEFASRDWESEEARRFYYYPEGPEFRVEYIHDRVEA